MNAGTPPVARTLVQSMTITALLHLTFMGVRVTLLLAAIRLEIPVWLLGLLQSAYPLAGAVFSIQFGRLIDERGTALCMRWGACAMAALALLPALMPTIPVFFVAALAIGAVANVFYLAAIQVIALRSPAADRVQWLSWNAVSISVASFLGPFIAGVAIDQIGPGGALGLLALPAAIACLATFHPRVRLPGPAPRADTQGHGGLLALWRDPRIRPVLFLGAALMILWDMHAFVVPVYGTALGLSATTIGLVISSLAISMFASRLALPALTRRFAPWTVVMAALGLATLGYALYPLATGAAAMFLFTAMIGLGAGVNQPLSNAMLIEYSPEGRSGETFGLRSLISHVIQLAIPSAAGALAAAAGIKLLFWLLAANGAAGVVFGLRNRSRFRRARHPRSEDRR